MRMTSPLFLCLMCSFGVSAGDRPNTGLETDSDVSLPPVQVVAGRPNCEARSDLDAANRAAAPSSRR